MAWTEVKCSECGETYRVQMYGKHRDREWKVNNWSGYCDECKLKHKEENERQKLIQSPKDKEEAKSQGLPELEGSPKQIQWAETLRVSRIEFIKVLIGKALEENCIEYAEWLKMKIESTKKQTSAKWFIDYRDSKEDAFRSAFKEYCLTKKAEEFLK